MSIIGRVVRAHVDNIEMFCPDICRSGQASHLKDPRCALSAPKLDSSSDRASGNSRNLGNYGKEIHTGVTTVFAYFVLCESSGNCVLKVATTYEP